MQVNQPQEPGYEQPAVVDSYNEQDVFGDAPAIATHALAGSQLPPNQV